METQEHLFQLCPSSLAASAALLTCLRSQEPDLTPEAILHLQLPIQYHLELPVVTIILTGYKYLWDKRQEGKVAQPREMLGELQAREHILQHTKHSTAAMLLSNMLQFFPP